MVGRAWLENPHTPICIKKEEKDLEFIQIETVHDKFPPHFQILVAIK